MTSRNEFLLAPTVSLRKRGAAKLVPALRAWDERADRTGPVKKHVVVSDPGGPVVEWGQRCIKIGIVQATWPAAGSQTTGLHLLGHIKGIDLYQYAFNAGAPDPEAEETALFSTVCALA